MKRIFLIALLAISSIFNKINASGIFGFPITEQEKLEAQWFAAVYEGQIDILKKIKVNVNIANNGETALMAAASRGYENIVTLLLQTADIAVNERDNEGRTALMRACIKGYDNIVKLLLKVPGIDVNVQDQYGITAVMWAIYKSRENIVKELCSPALLSSVIKGHESIARELYSSLRFKPMPESFKVNLNLQDNVGNTALILAAAHGHENIVEYLLTCHRNMLDINIQDDDGGTALTWAIIKGHSRIAQFIMQDLTLNINKRYSGDCCFNTFYYSNAPNILKYIFSGKVPEKPKNTGKTALMLAIKHWCDLALIEKILQMPGFDVNAQDEQGDTALSIACVIGHNRIIKLLLDHVDIKLNIKNRAGMNAHSKFKQWCAPGSSVPVDLIKEKIEALKLKHKSAIFKSIENGDLEIFRQYLTAIDDSIFYLVDDVGNTPLHYAFMRNCESIAQFILQQSDEPHELLALPNNAGEIPLELVNPTSAIFNLCLELAYAPKTIPVQKPTVWSRISGAAGTIKNWVSGQKKTSKAYFAKASKAGLCGYCSKSDCTLRCSKCATVYYCDPECQKAHWATHKHQCKSSE